MANLKLNRSWRRMAAAIYARPVDGKVSGFYDLDMTEVNKAIEEWNLRADTSINVMHFFMCALGHTMKYYAPELNCYIKWGDIVERDTVTISTAVLVGKSLTTVKIKDTHLKNVRQVSQETIQFVKAKRAGQDDKTVTQHSLSKIPWPVRSWVFKSIRWLAYECGWTIPGIGLSKDAFGSALVSNIGSLGLDYGIPALMPASNLSFVQAIGYVKEKAVVKDGEVVVQAVLPISATFDHRIVDGVHISQYLVGLKHYFENPHELMFDTDG